MAQFATGLCTVLHIDLKLFVMRIYCTNRRVSVRHVSEHKIVWILVRITATGELSTSTLNENWANRRYQQG